MKSVPKAKFGMDLTGIGGKGVHDFGADTNLLGDNIVDSLGTTTKSMPSGGGILSKLSLPEGIGNIAGKAGSFGNFMETGISIASAANAMSQDAPDVTELEKTDPVAADRALEIAQDKKTQAMRDAGTNAVALAASLTPLGPVGGIAVKGAEKLSSLVKGNSEEGSIRDIAGRQLSISDKLGMQDFAEGNIGQGMLNLATGGIAGTIDAALYGNSRAMKKERELRKKQEHAGALKTRLSNDNTTQANVYEDGTDGIANTKQVEVERDEVVMRKNANGGYSMVADFKGGKTHTQGGEPYVASEGEVIFPGKHRKKVMEMYNNGDNRGLETMRMRLPKDNSTGKFANGTRAIDDKKPKDRKGNVINFNLMTSQDLFKYISGMSEDDARAAKEQYAKVQRQKVKIQESDKAKRKADEEFLEGMAETYKEARGMDTKYKAPMLSEEMIDSVGKEPADEVLDIKGDAAYETGKWYDVADAEKGKATSKGDPYNFGNWYDPSYPTIPYREGTGTNENPTIDGEAVVVNKGGGKGGKRTVRLPAIDNERVSKNVLDIKVYPLDTSTSPLADNEIINNKTVAAGGSSSDSSKSASTAFSSFGDAFQGVMDYAPAAYNLMKGAESPELATRRFLDEDAGKIDYQDSSQSLRRKALEQDRINAANASKSATGGISRAYKAASSSQYLNQLTDINEREMARSLGVKNTNAQLKARNQQANIALANQYDDIDAKARANTEAYTSQGVADLTNITAQKRKDAKAEGYQNMMLNLIGTANYKIDPKTMTKVLSK